MEKTEIFELLVQCTREVIPELERHEFNPTDSLRNLGANSIDRADIIMMILENLELEIPLREIAGPKNIGELVDLLHSKR